jgi:tRNA(Ile)-lysidine synthase
MPRSHPPTLLTIAARTIREDQLFARGDRVLVAVSGGPDSMALLHVLAVLRVKLGHVLVAHGVDHGLRAEASSELDLAEGLAGELGVHFERAHVRLARGGNLQARAREARYDALRAAAAKASCTRIATAHHRADRAETVLLRLLRGAGPRGLGVLPPRAGDLVRPILHAPRSAIDAHVARHRLPFAIDPSNRDPHYARARVRHELLPLLRTLSPGIEEHLCALADQLLHGDLAPMPPDVSLPLARRTRDALATLAAGRSPKARIALKGGHVARWDPASRAVAVEPGDGELSPHRRK